jgi:hypothetical protein
MTEEVLPEQKVDVVNFESMALKELRQIASSPADTILKWAFLVTFILGGVLFYWTWQSNAAQPERMLLLLEKTIEQQSASLKVQEASLLKLQEFAVRVPLEHAEQATRLTLLATDVNRLAEENKILRDAVLANTQATGELIRVLKETNKNQ